MADQLFDPRNLLLFGHIVGAILLLGPLTAATSRFPAVVSTGTMPGDVAVAAELHRSTKAYGTAAVVVPVLGLVLAMRSDLVGAPWVLASLGLVAVAAMVLFAFVIPEQSKLIARLRSEGQPPIAPSDLTRLRAATGAFALTWIVIVLLMVAKPS